MNRSPALPSSSSVNGRRWTAMILSLLMLAGCSRPEPVPNPEISPSPTPSGSTVSEKLNDQQLKELVAKMDVQEKVGQLVIVSFETTEVDTKTEAWLRTNKIGNVIVYAKNIENAEQATMLTAPKHNPRRYPDSGIHWNRSGRRNGEPGARRRHDFSISDGHRSRSA